MLGHVSCTVQVLTSSCLMTLHCGVLKPRACFVLWLQVEMPLLIPLYVQHAAADGEQHDSWSWRALHKQDVRTKSQAAVVEQL